MSMKEIQERIDRLERTIAEKDREIRDLKDAPLSEYTMYLLRMLNHGLPVIGFAIANLPPLANRGWPADELEAFLNEMKRVVAIDKRYLDIVDDWLAFAAEARSSEAEHKAKKAKAPRAKPASKEQLQKMAADFDREFGAGSVQRRIETIISNK